MNLHIAAGIGFPDTFDGVFAAGVPLMCDEPDDFKTFRVGLFGLDKLNNIERTVENLEQALAKILD